MSADHADHSVKIQILDLSFNIKCHPEDELALLEAMEFLDEKMRATKEKDHSVSLTRLAIITALNISHELLQTRQRKLEVSEGLVERLNSLDEQLSEVLA